MEIYTPTNLRKNLSDLLNRVADKDEKLDTEPKLKQPYETYLALHDALMVKKHPAELANLLATYEPKGTAMDNV